MTTTYYHFISLEPITYVGDSGDRYKMALKKIEQPPIIDYIKSFFGIFKPWPKVIEEDIEVIGYNDFLNWEYTNGVPCSENFILLLLDFASYYTNNDNPVIPLIGRCD